MEDSFAEKLERLEFYRSEIKMEYDLLSNRMSAYVTSQSFLCIAFATSMGNLNPHWGNIFNFVFPLALAIIGIAASIQSHRGISAAFETIALWHLKQDNLFESEPSLDDYRLNTERETIQQRGLSFAKWSPLIFIFAWFIFGTLTIVLHLIV